MSTIESVLQEKRVFPPPAEFVKQANISGMDAYRKLCAEAERDFEGFWARHARETLHLAQAFHARCSTSRRRRSSTGSTTASSTRRTTASTGTSRRSPTRSRSSSRPTTARSRASPTRSCTSGSASFANALKALGIKQGRPRPHLHADVDRGGGRDAGVRAHRRHALGGVRRLLGEERAGAHHRRRRGRGHHRRRPVPRRQGDRAQARGRRGARHGRLRGDQERGRLQAHGQRGADEGGARHVVARRGEGPARDLRAHVRSTPSIRSSSSTPRARPASPRASSIPPAATCCGRSSR